MRKLAFLKISLGNMISACTSFCWPALSYGNHLAAKITSSKSCSYESHRVAGNICIIWKISIIANKPNQQEEQRKCMSRLHPRACIKNDVKKRFDCSIYTTNDGLLMRFTPSPFFSCEIYITATLSHAETWSSGSKQTIKNVNPACVYGAFLSAQLLHILPKLPLAV